MKWADVQRLPSAKSQRGYRRRHAKRNGLGRIISYYTSQWRRDFAERSKPSNGANALIPLLIIAACIALAETRRPTVVCSKRAQHSHRF